MRLLIVIIVLFFIAVQSRSAQLGEVTQVSADSITFFKGKEEIQVNDRLFLLNSYGNVNAHLVVTALDGESAQAQIVGYELVPGSNYLEKISKGQIVRLTFEKKEIKSFGFFIGPNFSSKVGGFGGTQYSLGLQFNQNWTETFFINYRLQADDLGKDTHGIGKRKSYYMIGLGYTYKNFQFIGDVGIVDIMTIPKEGTTETHMDPYTGASYPAGVSHSNNAGYLLSVQYPFKMKEVSRTERNGWSIVPGVSHANQFNNSDYKPITSIYMNFEFLFL